MAEVVITAGRTREEIDSVHYADNFSNGRLGHQIAKTFAEYSDYTGDNVTLIAPNSTIERFGLPDGVSHESFTTSRDLKERLLGIKAADIVIHFAIVSDSSPEKMDEQIDSELRDHFGERSRLIASKLFYTVFGDFDLWYQGSHYINENQLDMCIASDVENINDGNHRLHLFPKFENNNSNLRIIEGDTEYVGAEIAACTSSDVKRAMLYEIWSGGISD